MMVLSPTAFRRDEESPLLLPSAHTAALYEPATMDASSPIESGSVLPLLAAKYAIDVVTYQKKETVARRVTSTYGTLTLNQVKEIQAGFSTNAKQLGMASPNGSPGGNNQSETESDSDGSCGISATQPPVIHSILRIRSGDPAVRTLEKKPSSVGFVIDISDTDDEDDEYVGGDGKTERQKRTSSRRPSCATRCIPRRLTLEEKAALYRVRPDLELTPMPVLLRDVEELRRRRQRKLVFTMLGGTLIILMMVVMWGKPKPPSDMDATAQRARDREAFREFLEKHHYAPQGRFARVGTLEDKDLDALCRGTLGPVWAWTWRNIKNAEDMEIVKRNVNVARYSIDSCKQEREQAKAKRETLLSRKQQLEDALRQAREREQTLLASVRGVEHEREALVHSASEKRQRELLRKAFNAKKDETLAASNNLLEEAQWLATAADTNPPPENQVDILLAEFKRMLKTTQNAENIDFGDSDIQHLRGCSGEDLMAWLMEAASRPYDDVPENEEDAKYAAHVEKHSSSSHDALVQIQDLLRQSQAEHIASFVSTQKVYAKVHELKQRVDEAMAPEDAQYGLWGSDTNGEPNVNGEQALAAETVELQMQSQASAVALHAATRALDDVIKQVETHRQQKHELEDKVALMNQFDERQQEIVAQIRSKFRHNQELLESLTRKQARLRQVMADEIRPRVMQDSEQELSTWSRLVLDELRAFSSMELGRLDTAHVQLPVAPDSITEHARQAETTLPFKEFYINQVQDRPDSSGCVRQQQQRNGYHRLAQALKVPAYASWASILASLQESESQNTTEISEIIQQLERDIAEDRTQSIPEAQALVRVIQQSTGTLVSDMLPRLEHVVHVNDEIIQRSVPELDQAIDNWYNQPAWAARVEQQPNSTQSHHLDGTLSSAMEVPDLLR